MNSALLKKNAIVSNNEHKLIVETRILENKKKMNDIIEKKIDEDTKIALDTLALLNLNLSSLNDNEQKLDDENAKATIELNKLEKEVNEITNLLKIDITTIDEINKMEKILKEFEIKISDKSEKLCIAQQSLNEWKNQIIEASVELDFTESNLNNTIKNLNNQNEMIHFKKCRIATKMNQSTSSR